MKESFGRYLLNKEEFDYFKYLSEDSGFQVIRNNGGYEVKKDGFSISGNILNYSLDSYLYLLDLSSNQFRNSPNRDSLINKLNKVLRKPRNFFVEKEIREMAGRNNSNGLVKPLRCRRGAIYNPVTFNNRVIYIKKSFDEDSFVPKRKIASLDFVPKGKVFNLNDFREKRKKISYNQSRVYAEDGAVNTSGFGLANAVNY